MPNINASPINVIYTIPIAQASNNILARYHIECLNSATSVKKNVSATSIVPASAATTTPAFAGATGTVTFNAVPFLTDANYTVTVNYADNDSLETASFVKVGSISVAKLTTVTVINL